MKSSAAGKWGYCFDPSKGRISRDIEIASRTIELWTAVQRTESRSTFRAQRKRSSFPATQLLKRGNQPNASQFALALKQKRFRYEIIRSPDLERRSSKSKTEEGAVLYGFRSNVPIRMLGLR